MRLVRLELENFRPFGGSHTLELAGQGDSDRNVTVVHGGNGAGKTTLLNAFTWCLYGTLTPDVEEPERLVTDWVWDETPPGAEAVASVAMFYEHGGASYRLRRSVRARRDAERQRPEPTEVSLDVVGEDGASQRLEAHTHVIGRVLPEKLAQFFFFNGERVERLAHRDAYTSIANAIKTLLGLQQFERGLAHLPLVEREFNKRLRGLGNSQLSDLTEQIEALQDEAQTLRERRDRQADDLRHLADEKDALDALLREHAEAAPLQARREEYRADLEVARKTRDHNRSSRDALIGRGGYRMLTAALLPDVERLADRLREQGQLPSPLKRQFVEELLGAGKCICGTALTPGDEHRHAVEQWRATAGLAEVEGRWQSLAGQARGFTSEARETDRQLASYDMDIASAQDRVGQVELRLAEVDAQLERMPHEDVRALEEKRRDVERLITEANIYLHGHHGDLASAEARLAKLESQRDRAQVNDDRVRLLRRQVKVTQGAQTALRDMQAAASEVVRARLDARVREVYERICVKPFTPTLSESFALELWKGDPAQGLTAPKSTGENQLLSLAFVGALSEFAQEQGSNTGSVLGRAGGAYPVVMDAAFGNLDDLYKGAIAGALPGMAPQVVVLTSEAQGAGVVADRLRAKVGAEYVITTRSTRPDLEGATITVGGREYDYLVGGAEHDGADLTRVLP